MKLYLKKVFSVGESRKNNEFLYSAINDYKTFDKPDNSLPEDYYVKPTDILMYDLVPKADLGKLKKGIFKLYRKCYTHKYLYHGRSESDVDELIKRLDQTLHSGNSWSRIGLFDFAFNDRLDALFERFEINLYNFSSSYAVLQIRVVLSDSFKDEMAAFIHSNYKKEGLEICRNWVNSKGKSGARIGYGVSSGCLSSYAKCTLIYEQLEYLKSLFLKEMLSFFPFMLLSRMGKTIGIYAIETNITPDNRLNESIYDSLGLSDRYGFYFSEAERLYVGLSKSGINDDINNMAYVYNPLIIKDYEPYLTPNNMTLSHLMDGYFAGLYRIILLHNLGSYYLGLLSDYRNRVNMIKPMSCTLRKLLKLRSDFNLALYDFRKIDDELSINKEIEKQRYHLNDDYYVSRSIYWGRHTSDYLFIVTESDWEQVKKSMMEISNDLSNKIEISSSLLSYRREGSNRRIGFYQLLLAILTFVLLIYPDKAVLFSNAINLIINFFKNVFQFFIG